MAGMGPPPKRSGMRQRRNKTVAGAVLSAEGSGRQAPKLPDRECPCVAADRTKECDYCEPAGIIPWHPVVLERWAIAWASPMADEWLDADVHGLFIVADLWDAYWKGD